MKKLTVIADLAKDSLTCAEIKIAVDGHLQNQENSDISFIDTTPSTIHTGYVLNQIVEDIERYSRPLLNVILVNTDPRLHSNENLPTGKGAKPVVIRLVSGIYIVGPNSGNCFSFIKTKIDEVFTYSKDVEKGQFNSRDLYARLAAYLMDSLEDDLDLDEVEVDEIPALRGYYVGHIDNFGNIKTTITEEDFKGKYEYGDSINITLNGVEKKATFVKGLFAGRVGELVIYPGSSGKKDNRFLEIAVWQHFDEDKQSSGTGEFGFPHEGNEIIFK